MTEPNTQPDPRNAELSALTHALGLSHARVAELEADSADKLKLVTEWRECLDRRTAENDALREKLSALRKQLEESDASDAAYAQGFGAASKNCPMEDNPYDAGKPQAEECAIAWATGWLDRMWQVRAERAESRAERAERELTAAQTAARQAGRQDAATYILTHPYCREVDRMQDLCDCRPMAEDIIAGEKLPPLSSLPASTPAETPEALCFCGHPKHTTSCGQKMDPGDEGSEICECAIGSLTSDAPPVAPSAPATTGEALNCPCPSGCYKTPHCVGSCQEKGGA